MKTSSVRELDYALAWFLFFICATIGGTIAGFIGGGIVGFILGAAGVSMEIIRGAGMITGFILSIPVSYITFRVIVGRFIVSKIQETLSTPTTASTDTPPLP